MPIYQNNKGNQQSRNSLTFWDYVSRPDTVNQTLMVSGVAPNQVSERRKAEESQRNAEEWKQASQEQKRQLYRNRMAAYPGSRPLSDQEIDTLISLEEAEQPVLQQAPDQNLVGQYANMQSLYSAMGSPYRMGMTEAQVRANPEAAQTQLYQGARDLAPIQLAGLSLLGGGLGRSAISATGASAASTGNTLTRGFQGAADFMVRPQILATTPSGAATAVAVESLPSWASTEAVLGTLGLTAGAAGMTNKKSGRVTPIPVTQYYDASSDDSEGRKSKVINMYEDSNSSSTNSNNNGKDNKNDNERNKKVFDTVKKMLWETKNSRFPLKGRVARNVLRTSLYLYPASYIIGAGLSGLPKYIKGLGAAFESGRRSISSNEDNVPDTVYVEKQIVPEVQYDNHLDQANEENSNWLRD